MTGRASLRHRRARPGLTAGVSLGALLATASIGCGGATSDDDARARLADDLVAETDGALDDETAACVADALHAEFGDESFRRVLDARSAPAEDGRAADVRIRVIDVFAGCDAIEPIIAPGG